MQKPGNLSLFAIYIFLCSTFTVVAEESFEGIEVTGKSTVQLEGITAVNITIVERGVTSHKTSLLVKQKIKQIESKLKSSGVSQEDIETSAIDINTVYKTSSVNIDNVEVLKRVNGQHVRVNTQSIDQQDNSNAKKEIEASAHITVQMKEPGLYERIYDDLTKRGASEITQSESVGDINTYYSQALTQALDDAKYKAQDLALTMDVSLGKIITIQELSSSSSQVTSAKAHSNKKDTVSAEVKVRFRVE